MYRLTSSILGRYSWPEGAVLEAIEPGMLRAFDGVHEEAFDVWTILTKLIYEGEYSVIDETCIYPTFDLTGEEIFYSIAEGRDFMYDQINGRTLTTAPYPVLPYYKHWRQNEANNDK